MLLPRVLTAAVGIPLLLYLIHLGNLPFIGLTVGLAVLALQEYSLMLWVGGRGVQRLLTVVGGGAVTLAVATAGADRPAGPGIVYLTLSAVIITAMLSELLRREHSLDRAAITVFGVMFIGWTLGHLVLIRGLQPHGRELTFLLFIAVWNCDSCAYFAGRALGKRKLAKVISPKKTWEGFVGGLIGAVTTALIAQRFFMPEALSPLGAAVFGLLVGTLGQLSDLSQSLVKRAAGTKDSANLLPGHGGVFDRIDSFLLLAPVVYYALVLIN
jgi:phosphatidate cytidylyltransferase